MPAPLHPAVIRRLFDRLLVLGFGLGIALPLLLGIPRFELPEPAPGYTFTDLFNHEAEQSFGGRDTLIRAHNRLSCFWLRVSPARTVVLGKDDWLYHHGVASDEDASPVVDYRGIDPLSIGHLEQLRWGFQDQYHWFRLHGSDHLLAFIPSKPFLHPEHLPDSYQRGSGPSWREQMLAHLRAYTDVPVLDLTPALAQARQQGRVFDPTDSHWSHRGMFAAYTAIIEACRAYWPNLQPLSEDQFIKEPLTRAGGDLADMMELADDYRTDTTVWTPKVPRRARLVPVSEDSHSSLVGGTGDPTQPRAVVYRDSFSEPLNPYLAEHFREAEFVWWRTPGPWRRSGGWEMRGIEEKRPDLVLLIMADRILRRPMPYAYRIQRHFTEERFDHATHVIARGDPETGYDAFAPERYATFSRHKGNLIVHSDRSGARIQLPILPDVGTLLPILRIKLRPPAHSFLKVIEPAPRKRFWRSEGERILWREAVEQGSNILTIPIVDPEVRQPLLLDLGRTPGAYQVHRIEIRGYPRYKRALNVQR